ncbi:MAG: NIPSNAP family protein [Promethearchaeota archaeon]
MLYRTKSKTEGHDELDKIRAEFEEIYRKHEVNIVGFWENVDDMSEIYYLSRYEDEADYKNKTERLRSDDRYAQLSKQLDELRIATEATRLNPIWLPE